MAATAKQRARARDEGEAEASNSDRQSRRSSRDAVVRAVAKADGYKALRNPDGSLKVPGVKVSGVSVSATRRKK